jgi:hypothetical protein
VNDSSPSPDLIDSPTANRPGRTPAMASVLCPVLVALIYFALFECFKSHTGIGMPTMVVLVLVPLLLLLAGIALGIAAFVLVRKDAGKGVFGLALTGLCANGIFLAALIIVPFVLPFVIGSGAPTMPGGRLQVATNKLATASSPEERFYALNDAAKESFEVGHIDDARKYATELLDEAAKFPHDWNYGNAIQDGNLVLGRIAVRDGRIQEAKEYLLAAGRSPGSPQMNSFGPNLSLAKDLLEKGERDTVLQYFDLCRKFWQMDYGKLDEWSREVKAGETPDFGANLIY